MELIGIFLIAAALLVVAGLGKVVRPDDTARALVLLGSDRSRLVDDRQRRWRWIVRTGATAEAALGLAAFAAPRPPTAALVALSYAAFACVVLVARQRGGALATCGCFGRPDTPPTLVHLVLNLVFAATAVVLAVAAPNKGTLATNLAAQPGQGIPLILVGAAGLWLSVLAMSALGRLASARRLEQSGSRS